MTRRNDQRLTDILAAAGAITEHLDRGDLDDGLVFDEVRPGSVWGRGGLASNPKTVERRVGIRTPTSA